MLDFSLSSEIPILEKTVEFEQRIQKIRHDRSTPQGIVESKEQKVARRQKLRQSLTELRREIQETHFKEDAKEAQHRYIQLQNAFFAFMEKNPDAGIFALGKEFKDVK